MKEIGDMAASIADLDKLIEINPENILIYFNRGNIKQELGDLDGAIYDYSMAIKLYPDFARAYIARSSVKKSKNDDRGAKKDYQKAIRIFDRYKKMKAGDKSVLVDTTANFTQLIDINAKKDKTKDIVKGRIQDRNVIIRLENYFKTTFLHVDSLRAGRVQYYDNFSMKFNQKYNYSPAITITNRKETTTASLIEDNEKSIREKMINDRHNDEMMLAKSILYMHQDRFNKSLSILDSCLSINKDNILALLNKGVLRAEMIDYIQSIETKTSQLIEVKAYAVGRVKKKVIVDYSEPLNDFTHCIRVDKNFVFAWFNRANCNAKSLNIHEAIDDYTKVIELEPSFAQAYFNRGLLYIYLNNIDKAASDLSKAGEFGLTNSYNILNRYCKKEEE
jgi:tetratricopeptide (TPR) repeat protein